MKARRTIALLLSFALHAAPLIVLLVGARAAGDRSSHSHVVATATMAPDDKADPDAPPPPPRLDSQGVQGSSRLDVGGFTFDIDKIARRRNSLFPFVTGDLGFEYLAHSLM